MAALDVIKKSHIYYTNLKDTSRLEVSGRNSISLEDLSYALIGHPIQFSNYPHAQSLFSKLENFTATAVCLLFYLPARHLSPPRWLWFASIAQFPPTGLRVEKLGPAFTTGERTYSALEGDAASFEERPVSPAQSQIKWLLVALCDAAAATVF